MFKRFKSDPTTSKADVILTAAAAIIAVWKAVDTVKDFKAERSAKEIKEIER